ncbi:MAG: thiosulfate sulfurtransferase GlpE [Nitrococcus sp.]|nr:thiosulfate sulfurtransferase GlpE [Nitrococcus sp.]
MQSFKHLSPEQAHTMLEEQDCQLADIRDEQSYQRGHIPNATHLNEQSLPSFLEAADHNKALIVYCYHGNTSLSAAQFLAEKDFTEVYSMDGGFEAWRMKFPQEVKMG